MGEEEVEFASRDAVITPIDQLLVAIYALLESFSLAKVIKNGVPTVIAGKPNEGKSMLLNALLNEEREIVSDIHGTTRDIIEDVIVIEGVRFRFIATAGIRETEDQVGVVNPLQLPIRQIPMMRPLRALLTSWLPH
ncbi:MAG: tRNA modification GTPase [Cyclobacteriaceae bacterium]